jgi:hypothetical protein
MIVINVDDERDLNIFIFGIVFGLRESKADCFWVEKNYMKFLVKNFFKYKPGDP